MSAATISDHPRYAQPKVGEHDLATLERIIAPLIPELSHSEINRDDAAPLLDSLAIRVARGRTAVDLAIGDVLATLAVGDRTLSLGYSNIGDYARERLSISARTAQEMARLSRELVERPILQKAVQGGKVSPLRARIIIPVAYGEQETFWTTFAATKRVTVRQLKLRVREVQNDPLPTQDLWEQLDVDMTLEEREVVEQALRLARKTLKKNMPRWQCLEAICLEFLGSYPQHAGALDVERARKLMNRYVPEAETDCWQREYEWYTNFWDFLDPDPPTVAALRVECQLEPFALDAQLRELARMRTEWDLLLGRLAFLIQHYRLWRDMMFTSFDHYCRERLGLGGSAIKRRARLERQFWYIPELKQAVASKRISYSKAALLAQLPYPSIDPEIAWAEEHTCLELRDKVARDREAYEANFLPSGEYGTNSANEAFPGIAEAKACGVLDDTDEWQVVPYRKPGDDDEADCDKVEGDEVTDEPTNDGDEMFASANTDQAEDARGASANDGGEMFASNTAQAEGARGASTNDGGEMFASANTDQADDVPGASTNDDGGEMFASTPGAGGRPGGNPNVGFRLSLPEAAITAIAEAIQGAQDMSREVGHPIGPGTALALIAQHFIDICRAHKISERGKRNRIIERTGGRCGVPGCSRGSSDVHHVVYRSHNGGDTTTNLVAICGGHHDRGIHNQRLRVRGNADRELVWELGLKNGVPLETRRVPMVSASG